MYFFAQLCEVASAPGKESRYDVGLNIVDAYTEHCNPKYVCRHVCSHVEVYGKTYMGIHMHAVGEGGAFR